MPRPKVVRDPAKAARARRAYRQSVTGGTPLSKRKLAEQFGMSPQWGADRIAEAQADPKLTQVQ